MTSVKITIFNGIGTSKKPKSKNDDQTFVFATNTCDTLKEAMNFMAQHYSLSKPLEMVEPISKRRLKTELEPYVPDTIENIAIDLDKIYTQEDYYRTVEFFRDKGYSIILGKSKGFNGKDKFTLKGIMRVNLTNTYNIIEAALTQLQNEIGDCCEIDLSVKTTTSLQAPSHDDYIVYYQEKGKVISDSDIQIEEVKETLGEKPDIRYDNEIIDKSLEIFWSQGYKIRGNGLNENGSINFEHFSEVKSKGGYFWFATNPFIMNHHDRRKTTSIFSIIKDTEEGKKFLKNKTKDEQKNELIKTHNINNYRNYLIVNERYLNFEKQDKIDLVEDFIDSEQGILKIKSAMGSAKSAGIDLVIRKAHERGEKVILVSNRVSVAEDFSKKYDIMMYKDPKAQDSDDSLVVQYDSLHRFNLSKYDIVIFDEFISLLLHHRANLTSNANVNAVKFMILLQNKRTVVADAFLTGYEDSFFKGREIFAIMNEYKDDIDLFEYENKENFIGTIIDKSKNLNDGEHISCSFTSLNVLKVVENELRERGIKVIALTSETSDLTKSIIYKRFEEETHLAFQVILFTPTLTVGVSNLNNTPYHFHYDSGMSTDVISSLQMTKRSRNTKEIHYYLDERQFYYDTDLTTLNNIAEKNINTFYNKKDKTLLIDVDYDTGNLVLTPLANYINQIEVFYNVLTNNHANAFKLLLNYQFENNAEIVDTVDESFSLSQKVKAVKDAIKKETIDILEKYSDVTWNALELDEIRAKSAEKSPEEKAKLIIGTIQEKFKKPIPSDKLKHLASLEIDRDYTFVSQIKNMKIALNNNDDYTKYRLSTAISQDISSLQNKRHIEFLEYILSFDKSEKLKNSYSKNDIKAIDLQMGKGKKFEKFLKKIGYSWGEARLRVQEEIFDYIEYL